MKKVCKDELTNNMIFVGTIYDSFEALEETLGKLKLEKPLFITHIAKMAFAEEVFKRADEEIDIIPPVNANKMNEQCVERFFN